MEIDFSIHINVERACALVEKKISGIVGHSEQCAVPYIWTKHKSIIRMRKQLRTTIVYWKSAFNHKTSISPQFTMIWWYYQFIILRIYKYASAFQVVKRLKIKYIGEENTGENRFGLTLPKNTFALYDRWINNANVF